MTSDSKPTVVRPAWGLMPDDIIATLNHKQWHNTGNLKRLLKGESSFPIRIPLKPPRGNAVLEDIGHFQQFVRSWQQFSGGRGQRACEISWEQRTFRSLSEQVVPTVVSIPDIAALACLLGEGAERQLRGWQHKVAYVLDRLAPLFAKTKTEGEYQGKPSSSKARSLFSTLIDHLDMLDTCDDCDLDLLVKLIPQLKKDLGAGGYLRALPVTCVDTKFIENNFGIIESMAAALIDPSIAEQGLLRWLHCKPKPMDWLLVKPLCEQTKATLGGVALLRLCSETLLEFPLPAGNILVIENEQSCLALDHLANTIAVSGGGKNLAWMRAEWLAGKRVGYWGDIDSEGLNMLSDARSKQGALTPLMMDAATVKAYQPRMVAEPHSVLREPPALTSQELELFQQLRAGHYANTRLEQERLPMDYVNGVLQSWAEAQG